MIIVSGTAAPQCGNYDDALVAAKTSAALGCGAPGMASNGVVYWERFIRLG